MPDKKINYGIDAPKVIRNLLVIGMAFILLSIFLPSFKIADNILINSSMFILPGISLLLTGILMLLYSRFGKFRQRERILNLVAWRGDEIVLDVGTGLGLLMIGAAKRLTTGKSYGIDIFNTYDLSDNSIEQTKINIELENVADKCTIIRGNILENSFDSGSFDVIVSNLCLHNIYNKQDRIKACNEIFRILKPGGKAVISDFKHTGECRQSFVSCGMKVHKEGTYYIDTFPPLTIIVVTKFK